MVLARMIKVGGEKQALLGGLARTVGGLIGGGAGAFGQGFRSGYQSTSGA